LDRFRGGSGGGLLFGHGTNKGAEVLPPPVFGPKGEVQCGGGGTVNAGRRLFR